MALQTSFKRQQMVTFSVLFISYTLIVYLRKAFTFVAPVISNELDLGKSDLGLISSTQLFAYSVSKFMSGMIVDFHSPRVLLAIGLSLTAIVTILFAMSSSLWILAILWGLNGWCQGVAWPACSKILINWFPSSEFGTWWSILSTAMNVAGTMGPLVAVFVVHHTNWQTSMAAPGFLTLLFTGVVLSILHDQPSDAGLPNLRRTRRSISETESDKTTSPKDKSETKTEKPKSAMDQVKSIGVLLSDQTYFTIAVSYLLTFLITCTVSDWGQLYLIQERGRTNIEGSTYMSCLQFGGVIGSIVSGFTSDKLVPKSPSNLVARISVLSMATTLACLFVYLFINIITPESSGLLINTIGFGLGFGLYGSIAIFGVAAIESAPRSVSGLAQSLAGLFCSVGGIISGLPMSILAKNYGWTGALWVLQFVCVGVLFLLSQRLYRESKRALSKKKI